MGLVAQVAAAMQTGLTTHAEQAAWARGFCRRRSKLGGAAFRPALVFGCLSTPEPTLEDGTPTAAACGAAVRPQALGQRFTAAAAKRRARRRKKAGQKGRAVSAAQGALGDWNVYGTNRPPALAGAAAIGVRARARWQIELPFKLWESDARLDESRGAKPWRVACALFAQTAAVVVQHGLRVAGCGPAPGRSWRKAAKAARRQALALAAAASESAARERAIAVVVRCLRVAGRVDPRRRKPATYQTLERPTAFGRP
jgi:hypothetical protein